MGTIVCDIAELEEATPRVFRVNGRAVAVVRIAEEVFALDAFCPHWKGPLGTGKISVERREIICPWHLFRYSLDDGSCVAANNRPSVEVFQATIDNGQVVVQVPEKITATTAA